VKVENRKASKFQTLKEKNLLVELEDAGDVTSHQFDSHVSDVYGTGIEYITEWIHPFNDWKCMSWVTLWKRHTGKTFISH
jgi:hypothetical protein